MVLPSVNAVSAGAPNMATEKRRSTRTVYNVTIQLAGVQPGAATAVAQPARAMDVSEHGALIECRGKFDPGAEVMIHNPKNLQTGLFKVVRAKPSPAGGAWHLGIEMLEPLTAAFWA
jgi:hypothetical protein